MFDFVNITSADNWFKQHPEKIAGVEFETTSMFFPIQVKGTKDDVLRVTGVGANNNSINKRKFVSDKIDNMFIDQMSFYNQYVGNDSIQSKKLAIAKAKAKAIKIKLLLN